MMSEICGLPMHNTIISVLAANFIMNRVDSYEYFLAFQHVGLFSVFGKSSTELVPIRSGVHLSDALNTHILPDP